MTVEQRRDDELAKIDARRALLAAKLEQVRADDLRRAEETREKGLADSNERFAQEMKSLREAYQDQVVQ